MLINNNDQLKQFLVKSQKDNLIGVDTEFYRVSTYDPKLCLLQFSNRSQIMIVDPLNKKIDLELIKEILFSKKILKIFHAAYQDIEIIFNLFGKIPEKIIDIQICLTELGYPNSTGYAEACKYLLGIKIDKKNQFIDWRKRPLSEEKINYASKDVKYLPDLYLKITKKIELETNLNISIKHKKLLDIDAFKKKPERAWKKLKINETEKYEIRKLRELCFLREKIAKKVNVPVKRIISDQQIRLLCKKKIEKKRKIEILRSIKSITLRDKLLKIF